MNTFQNLRQKHSWFLPVIILAVAALIIFALVVSKPKPPKKETKEKEWLVSSIILKETQAQPQVELLARVESPFDSTLSAAITADVMQVPVREGISVKMGDLLVQLDAREIELTLAQRQADINELDALIDAEKLRFKTDQDSLVEEKRLLEIAEQALARQAKLKASNLVAQERYDSAESSRAQQALSVNARKLNIADHPNRLKQLQAKKVRALTLLKDAEIDAERAQIRAPFDGIVTSVKVAPGERIQMGQALVSLYDRKNMELRAQVPDKYLALISDALQQGINIQATALSHQSEIPLQLLRLSGQASLSNGGVDALFRPASEEHNLILNKALRLRIDMPALTNVFTLPVSAIYGTNRIYRIEEGRLQSLNIEVLGKQLLSLSTNSANEETLQDRVIIRSKHLGDGDKVTTTQLPNAISGLKVKERS
ncbi:hypothetical protein A3749_08610 [Oleiphilus sp. HI0078]|jgi:multidrug efflux pump subunit AcrA (membrane-fusion protein)|uniref:efflux RND transporter periplasmic adaptor subunit n=2 Tax=Oleiphilus TaxID=141450 RepID=UPI0007C3F864|nr:MULTISPECIES: biotin/lipoyl-binding protein [unclassified Oleiphilus]KZY75530.1 hypothetical protein A3740_00250 [Oleiphilus sp. HI0068]KZY77331.1 hypothetical protein A3741_09815 [Oleiphilus sp. HI0069]KZZ11586.1 hypothetical protein A3749_08610 [Oleiphilus sp. HI0078]KZZ34413.1 hypothetical protein A3755_06065 [Oleiphilus sp. HI0085]KZY33659.1 hypothetical protein A3729_06130 [Oleiphilus sp. HI0043]